MSSENQPAPASTPTWMSCIGWFITALPALLLLASGGGKLAGFKPPEGGPNIGWSETAFFGLGLVEIGCTLLYLFPRTAILGAILLTGYLGGAVATHVRIADLFVFPIIAGFLVWLGLFLRDERLRALLPWRGDSGMATGGFLSGFAKVLLTVAALVGVIVGLIAAQPAEMRIERKGVITAPPSEVFAHVNDFRNWDAWSPWAKIDPAVKNTFEGPSAGAGAIFKWSGNDQVGEGKMTMTESRPSDLIKIKLEFIKPMEATDDVEFTFKATEKGTEVTWVMTGKKTFLFKAMGLVMNFEKMLGGDFEKGLASMKSVVEVGKKQ